MKAERKLFTWITLLTAMILMVAIFVYMIPTQMVYAEDTSGEVTESTSEEIDPNENDAYIVNSYEEAEQKATEIVEQIGLKEYLEAYFEENMVNLIITIVIGVLAFIIFVSSIVFLVIKLYRTIKKFGIQSDATKEIANQTAEQLKQFTMATDSMKETTKLLTDNYESLKTAFESVAEGNETIQKILQLMANKDVQQVSDGTADEINDIVANNEG